MSENLRNENLESDDEDVTEFEIKFEPEPEPELEPELGTESASDILKRARALIKSIDDKIEHLREEFDELRFGIVSTTTRKSLEKINKDMREKAEKMGRLKIAKEKVSEESKEQISRNKEKRDGKK